MFMTGETGDTGGDPCDGASESGKGLDGGLPETKEGRRLRVILCIRLQAQRPRKRLMGSIRGGPAKQMG